MGFFQKKNKKQKKKTEAKFYNMCRAGQIDTK